jgi:hypothetical protein
MSTKEAPLHFIFLSEFSSLGADHRYGARSVLAGPVTQASKVSCMTPTSPATEAPVEDPLVTKYVEAALEPHKDRLPPEDLEVYRARLCLYYETDPDAVALLDEIRQEQRKAPAVARSGEQSREDEAALAEAVRRKVGGSKRSER